MAAIRILQVFTIMDRGGAESMIMNYYRKIDRTKVQFDFLVHRNVKGVFEEEIESLGGKIYRVCPINPLFPNKYYNELRVFFRAHLNYKVVHAHLNTFSSFPLKIAKEFNIPCRIAHAHIAIDKVNLSSFFSQKENLKEILKKVIKLQLKRRIKKNTTHLFSCGQKAGIWLFGDAPFTTMNNAIDTEKFKYNESISATYRKEFKLENELIIGHIGRFVSQKNHMFLLQIFAELIKKQANTSLIIIGDGPLRKSLEKKAERLGIIKKVHFLGVRKDIPQLCQMMDVFVFPSFYEGLPVTLIEAQAAGLKIIASDTITQEILLTENITLIPLSLSPEAWADNLIAIQNYDRVETASLIRNKHYDIVANTKEIQAFYLQQVTD